MRIMCPECMYGGSIGSRRKNEYCGVEQANIANLDALLLVDSFKKKMFLTVSMKQNEVPMTSSDNFVSPLVY